MKMLQVNEDVLLSSWDAAGFFRLLSCWLDDKMEDYKQYADSLPHTRPSLKQISRAEDGAGTYVLYFKKVGRFYIGSSWKMAERVGKHLSMMRKGKHHNSKMMRAVIDCNNQEPEVLFIYTRTESLARAVEQRLIDLVFMDPYCLNQRMQVEEYRPTTEETREKLQTAAKKQWTDEFRKKIQEINKKPEELARRIAAGLKLKNDPEYMEKLRNASKKLWDNPDYADKIKASGKACWGDDKYRQRHSEMMKAKWADPEYKKKVSAKQHLARWASKKKTS